MTTPGRTHEPAPSAPARLSPVPPAGRTRLGRDRRPQCLFLLTLDLGGTTVETWAYGDAVPGQTVRATAGDLLRVTVDNALPTDTSVHWHVIRLRNAAGVLTGVTQDPIAPGSAYLYEFTAPDPGTYFLPPAQRPPARPRTLRPAHHR